MPKKPAAKLRPEVAETANLTHVPVSRGALTVSVQTGSLNDYQSGRTEWHTPHTAST